MATRAVKRKALSSNTGAKLIKESVIQAGKRTHSKTDAGLRNQLPCNTLPRPFFQQTCEDLAVAILGKTLVRKLTSGVILRGTVVETEAYLGEHDRAAHSYELKRTKRNQAMFMEPGTIYVYNIYGMYTCINISSLGNNQQ